MMRLDARTQRRLVELHHREQVVLIGDGDGRHALRGGSRDEIVHAHDAVDQRVLGVQAEVDEAVADMVRRLRTAPSWCRNSMESSSSATGANERRC